MMKDSKELGRVYGVDSLKHTNLRVRGMFELAHPAKVFGDYVKDTVVDFPQGSTAIYLVIRKSDYDDLEATVDLSDQNHDLTDFYDEGRLDRIEVELPSPDGDDVTEPAYIFVGYTS